MSMLKDLDSICEMFPDVDRLTIKCLLTELPSTEQAIDRLVSGDYETFNRAQQKQPYQKNFYKPEQRQEYRPQYEKKEPFVRKERREYPRRKEAPPSFEKNQYENKERIYEDRERNFDDKKYEKRREKKSRDVSYKKPYIPENLQVDPKPYIPEQAAAPEPINEEPILVRSEVMAQDQKTEPTTEPVLPVEEPKSAHAPVQHEEEAKTEPIQEQTTYQEPEYIPEAPQPAQRHPLTLPPEIACLPPRPMFFGDLYVPNIMKMPQFGFAPMY